MYRMKTMLQGLKLCKIPTAALSASGSKGIISALSGTPVKFSRQIYAF